MVYGFHSLFRKPIPLTSPADAPLPDPEAEGAPSIDAIDEAELDLLDAPEHAPPEPRSSEPESEIAPADLQALILKKLDDDQAEDVVVIDLEGKSPLADAVVIASGRSQRHVSAIADHLQRALKDAGLGRAPVEGLPHADWVLIDAGDVVVHLFRPEVRAFYQIEKIWSVDSPHRTASA